MCQFKEFRYICAHSTFPRILECLPFKSWAIHLSGKQKQGIPCPSYSRPLVTEDWQSKKRYPNCYEAEDNYNRRKPNGEYLVEESHKFRVVERLNDVIKAKKETLRVMIEVKENGRIDQLYPKEEDKKVFLEELNKLPGKLIELHERLNRANWEGAELQKRFTAGEDWISMISQGAQIDEEMYQYISEYVPPLPNPES